MSRYWWVNHNTTFEHEIDGGYLWSPQREVRARSTSYDNMRRVTPGDMIVSYAGQQNRHVGIVTDFAVAAPKPAEFGSKGSYWSDIGWYVPVTWIALQSPVRHREFWDEFRALLPEKYSPIVHGTQNGNQKLYLAEISAPLFDLVFSRSGSIADTIKVDSSIRSDELVEQLEAHTEYAIRADPGLDDTVRQALVEARRGQGRFRAAVKLMSARCCVTGIEHDALLVASHIKPWRACTEARERLDGANGLMLTPHIDRLFDRGFITFELSGKVHVSAHLSDMDLSALGCARLRGSFVAPFPEAQGHYLAYHREHAFLPG